MKKNYPIYQKIAILLSVSILFLFLVLIYRALPHTDTAIPTPPVIDSTPSATSAPTSTPIAPAYLPSVDSSNYDFTSLDRYISDQIDMGFPGAVLTISENGTVIFSKSYGYSNKYDGLDTSDIPEPMREDTLFDIASLTKIYATTLSIMKLSEQGLIHIDDPVSKYLPDYIGDNKEHVTIRMLLSHSAGYTQTQKHYMPETSPYYSTDRERTGQIIQAMPLDVAPNTVSKYSDTNFILLMCIIEQVSGITLDQYAYTNIYMPLGLDNHICYQPLDMGISPYQIASTERCGNTRDYSVTFPNIRTYTLRGQVHDENAYYSLGSVSGHAGLFADTYALTVLNNMLLAGGEIDGRRVLSQETIDQFTTIYDDSRYQLGFWSARSNSKLKDYVSPTTVYHTGWTGCVSLIDFEKNISILLLTNKRHCPIINDSFDTDQYDISRYYGLIQNIYQSMLN